MFFPAKLTPTEDDFYIVTFRDIPEAITQGESRQAAKVMAKDALLTSLEFYFEDNRLIPSPSTPIAGEEIILLPASIWAKVLLLNTMVETRIKQKDLAQSLGVKPQEITRMLNLRHATKIDQIQRAISALGKTLNLSVE